MRQIKWWPVFWGFAVSKSFNTLGRWQKMRNSKLDKQTTQTHCMLSVLIFAISFLANTISVERYHSSTWIYLFSPLRFLLAICFIFNKKPMSRKKRKAKWETEIDFQETKTEQSQRLWRTETNVQNSIKRWCYNCM